MKFLDSLKVIVAASGASFLLTACADNILSGQSFSSISSDGTSNSSYGTPRPNVAFDPSSMASVLNTNSQAFYFSSDSQNLDHFKCKLDGGDLGPCTSPLMLSNLTEGQHTLEVLAYDAAMNAGNPAIVKFVVDTIAPEVAVTNEPQPFVNTKNIEYQFAATDSGTGIDSIMCQFDDGAMEMCTSPKAYQNLEDGLHTIRFVGRDKAGNLSQTITKTVTIDTIAPTVTLESMPAKLSNSTSAQFAFVGVDVNGIMKSECKMDQQDFSVCSSPMTYNGLTEGNHTFVVRVTDNAGNVSTPLSYEFAVDTLPPMVKIDSAPGTLTNSNSASFAFSTTMQSMDTFECKLDNGAYTTCVSPKSYTGLADGIHTFSVRAKDTAGNVSNASSHSWTVDTKPPTILLSTFPDSVTSNTSATFAFSAIGGDAASFECALDNGAFAKCNSPKSYSGLAEGSHVFKVVATDLAGNKSQATQYMWTIQLQPTVQMATLSWDNNTEPDLAGYRLYYGTSSGNYTQSVDVGKPAPVNGRVQYILNGLESGKTYYFAVKAYDTSGTYSDYSNEVMKSFVTTATRTLASE